MKSFYALEIVFISFVMLVLLSFAYWSLSRPVTGNKVNTAIEICAEHKGVKVLYTQIDRVICEDGFDVNMNLE